MEIPALLLLPLGSEISSVCEIAGRAKGLGEQKIGVRRKMGTDQKRERHGPGWCTKQREHRAECAKHKVLTLGGEGEKGNALRHGGENQEVECLRDLQAGSGRWRPRERR